MNYNLFASSRTILHPNAWLTLGLALASCVQLYGNSAQGNPTQPQLNEVVSANVTGLSDEYEPDLSNCPVPDCEQWYKDLGVTDYDGQYPDWIEVHNPSSVPIALQGYGLSDSPEQPFKWVFPELTLPPNGFLVVFASGKDKAGRDVHTNFKLSSDGEEIVLTSPAGEICDRLQTGKIPIDCSLGRLPNPSNNWVWFNQPTPGQANSTPVFPGFQGTIELSAPAGVYAAAVTVALKTDVSGAAIFYTLDGNNPTPATQRYEHPIAFQKTAVLRAQAYDGETPVTPVATATYLVDEAFTFPIVSLSISPDDLWDPDLGIYTPGRNARESQRVANYWQDWERPVHVEFFEPNGQSGFSTDAGLRIYGWGSRSNPQKSLAVMLRDQYGAPGLDYPLFPELPLHRFHSFVLRAGGTDAVAHGTFFRDSFAASLVKTRNVDSQAYRPAVVFINGEYWGIHDLREKLNEEYLASHHNVDAEEVDIISRYWRRTAPVVVAGNDQAYLELEEFLSATDMTSSAAYEAIQQFVDVENFADYTAAQIYFANFDWPGNNNKLWRARQPDARWRWLMYDLDYALSFDSGQSDYTHDTLAHATLPDGTGWPNPSWTTLAIRKLLEVPAVQAIFINRLADLLNEDFAPDRVLAQLARFEGEYEREMPAHLARWAGTGNVIPSLSTWRRNIETIRTFVRERPNYVREHLVQHFGLPGTVEVQVSIDPPEAGRVKLNSLLISGSGGRWNGIYFEEVPIQVDALPAPGYRFAGWEGTTESGLDPMPRTTVALRRPLDIRARFEPDPGAVNAVIISEINSVAERDGPGDWVEIHNANSVEVDLSGWTLSDGLESHRFTFPAGTVVSADGFLVLCSDKSAFQKKFPAVRNYLGDLGFGFDKDGDQVRLFDHRRTLVDIVSYGAVDERSPVHSLRDPGLDNGLSSSWETRDTLAATPGAPNRSSESEDRGPAISAVIDGEELQLRFASRAGRSYRLETSHNLIEWQLVDLVPGTDGPAFLLVKLESDSAARFFRVVEVR